MKQICLHHKGTSQSFFLKDKTLIGRPNQKTWPDIEVSSFPSGNRVSRLHAVIKRCPEGLFIEDLGSSNGTFLNHQWLMPYCEFPLKIGDVIELAEVLELELSLQNEEE